jgi:acetyl esterase
VDALALSRRESLRERAGGYVVRALFEGLAGIARLHPRSRPSRHGVVVERNVRFGPGPTDRCDVYRPRDATGPRPIALYLHGGGFRILSKDTHWVMGLALARHGYVAVLPDYRLAPRHRFPAGLEDAARALAWVWERAGELGGDRERFVLAGESAGGNFATALAIACATPRPEPYARALFDAGIRPRATIAMCPILEVTRPDRFRARWAHLSRFVDDRIRAIALGYLTPDALDATSLANPLVLLEAGITPARPLPPFLFSVGLRDPLLDDTRRAAAALARAGVPHEAHFYPGGVHAFQAFVWQARAKQAWQDVYAFLDRTIGQAA